MFESSSACVCPLRPDAPTRTHHPRCVSATCSMEGVGLGDRSCQHIAELLKSPGGPEILTFVACAQPHPERATFDCACMTLPRGRSSLNFNMITADGLRVLAPALKITKTLTSLRHVVGVFVLVLMLEIDGF